MDDPCSTTCTINNPMPEKETKCKKIKTVKMYIVLFNFKEAPQLLWKVTATK